MFREIAELIKARPLTMTVVGLGEDRLRVCVIPQSLESDNSVNAKAGHHKEVAKVPEVAIKALTTPLCLEGTVEELDAEMPAKLIQFNKAHGVLRGALATAEQQIAEAVQTIEQRDKQKSKDKDKKPTSKAGTNKDALEKADGAGSQNSGSLPLEWCAPPVSTTSASDQNSGAQGKQGEERQC
jgi:PRTRC genetic system protein E